jgi:thioesterase domain-containing protein
VKTHLEYSLQCLNAERCAVEPMLQLGKKLEPAFALDPSINQPVSRVKSGCIKREPEMLEDRVEPKHFPISLNQKRFWIVDQFQPGRSVYHIPICLRLNGPLALDTLDRSIAAIVARHESLRTTFDVRDSVPVQLINSFGRILLRVHRIYAHQGMDLETQACSMARREIEAPFDLKNGPLIRVALLRLSPQDHILVITMHHIVSDGWSAELFISELAELYGAFSAGREPSLKSLPFQYSDFTLLNRHLISSKRIEQQLSFWKRTLSDAPALHDFPCDRARPEQPTFAGACQVVQLDSQLVTDLQRFARDHRVTFFMLLTAAFQTLVSKYSGKVDILTGIPVSGRNIVDSESLIGLFVNTLVLRTSVFINDPFTEVLSRVRANLLDAMSNQDVPFDLIVDTVRIRRSPSYNPLFQIMFSTFRAALQSRDFGGLIAVPYAVESTSSQFDLSVNVIEGIDRNWWVRVEYSTELLDHARITRMVGSYKELLRSILTNSHRPLCDLPLSNDARVIVVNTIEPLENAPRSIPLDYSTRTLASANGGRIPIPFDDVERKLIEIWRRFLGLSSISVDDDFVDLGGNSLLAIALIADVNRVFNRTIPVSVLFRDTTIRAFAQRLREQMKAKPSFVRLAETGLKPPLFVASNHQNLGGFSRALGKDQPFFQLDPYALQEERLIAKEPLFTTIEEMAFHFVKEIISVQPSGPYFLAGQCDGGIIALEIARQLQRQGHKIALLMQFDTPVTGYFEFLAWHRFALQSFRHACWILRRCFRFRSIARRIGILFSLKKLVASDKYTTTVEYIWSVIWNAVRTYNDATPLDAEITLFRARKLTLWAKDIAIGWDRLGTVQVCDVPGDHLSLFEDRDSQAIIRHVLESSQRAPDFKHDA